MPRVHSLWSPKMRFRMRYGHFDRLGGGVARHDHPSECRERVTSGAWSRLRTGVRSPRSTGTLPVRSMYSSTMQGQLVPTQAHRSRPFPELSLPHHLEPHGFTFRSFTISYARGDTQRWTLSTNRKSKS